MYLWNSDTAVISNSPSCTEPVCCLLVLQVFTQEVWESLGWQGGQGLTEHTWYRRAGECLCSSQILQSSFPTSPGLVSSAQKVNRVLSHIHSGMFTQLNIRCRGGLAHRWELQSNNNLSQVTGERSKEWIQLSRNQALLIMSNILKNYLYCKGSVT